MSLLSVLSDNARVLHVTLGDERTSLRRVLRKAPGVRTVDTVRFEDTMESPPVASFDVIVLEVAAREALRAEEAILAFERWGTSVPVVVVGDDEDTARAETLVQLGAADVVCARPPEPRAIGRALVLAIARGQVRDAAFGARDEAVRASRAKTEFLANVSHELRAPLNTVLGMADLLAEADLTDKAAGQLAALRRAGDHILALADDILDLAGIESGSIVVQRAPLDLVRVAESAIELVTPAAREKKLDLRFEHGPDSPRLVMGDARRLRQILVNLLGNAVKFTGSGAVSLTSRAVPGRPDEVRLGVHDTGIGIPGDRLEAVFASFVQSDETIAQRFGGVGLGLHIVKQLVRVMGGRIDVKSELDRGSDFIVTLPLPAADEESARGSGPPEVPRALPASGVMRSGAKPIRALLVDDSWESRALVTEHLRGTDIVAEFAADGRAALAQLAASPFDVVLMDLHLPGMDGFATTIALRKMEREKGLRPIPVVALSADALAETVKRALAAGCAEHLSKPITRHALVEALRAHTSPAAPTPPPERASREPCGPAGMSPQAVALFPQFLGNREKDVSRAREALARGDHGALARLGHNMRGNGVSYGLPRISTIGGLLEDAANTDDVDAVRRHIDALEAYVASVRAAARPDGHPPEGHKNGSGFRPRVDAPASPAAPRVKRPRE